jgi:hypothetical protein
MDEWLASAGGSDDARLSLGLDLLDAWQASGHLDDPSTGQQHLAASLQALRSQRSVAMSPDVVALCLWFHDCGRLDPSFLDRLAEVGGPALAIRVRWLVRGLAGGGPRPGDPAMALAHAVHRSALCSAHLTPVRPVPRDQ